MLYTVFGNFSFYFKIIKRILVNVDNNKKYIQESLMNIYLHDMLIIFYNLKAIYI